MYFLQNNQYNLYNEQLFIYLILLKQYIYLFERCEKDIYNVSTHNIVNIKKLNKFKKKVLKKVEKYFYG